MNKKKIAEALLSAAAALDTITVYRGVDAKALAFAKKNGHLPPSDPKHAIPNDPDILEHLYPDEWRTEQETGDTEPLDEALKRDIPWYDGTTESIKWSVNALMSAADVGYGKFTVALEVPREDVAVLEEYCMVRDIREAKILSSTKH